MASMLSLPCPVRLGLVRQAGPQAELHRCTLERNITKMEKLLKKGVDVDCVNDLGQTCLFCACLVGLTSVAELLLLYGANPNHRCHDCSTPVHAVAFSCNTRLLSALLDAGGDLRLHNAKGQRPQDWATAGAQPNGRKMLEFLNSCMSQMQSLVQQRLPGETRRTPSSSKMLLRPPSLKDLLKPGGSDVCLGKKSSSRSGPWGSVLCFGFGKLCVERRGQPVGLLACVPLVSDVELTLQEDEPPTVFMLADHTNMSNSSWKGCRVTVKDLLPCTGNEAKRMNSYEDLLLREQDYCSCLHHPHLLQLLAVTLGPDLHTRLVFERVHIGPLHDIIHHKRAELPVLPVECVSSVLLQVCDALLYLHARRLVLRALSSHSVLMVRPTLAKLTSLGFITSVDGSVCSSGPPPPLPAGLMNWVAPEVVMDQLCTERADIYSVCVLIQEIYTDALPWGCLSPGEIRRELDEGRALPPHPSVPPPYNQLLQQGLQPQPQHRQLTLQQLRYTLHTHSKEMLDVTGSISSTLSPTKKLHESLNQSVCVEAEIQHQLRKLDRILQVEEQRGGEKRRSRSCVRMDRTPEQRRARGERERIGTQRGGEERREREERGLRRGEEKIEREERGMQRGEEREERGMQRTISMYVMDRRRRNREEEEEEDGESETTEAEDEESTTSPFTERWSEREREEESDFSMGTGPGRRGSDASCPPHVLTLDDWKASPVPDSNSEDMGPDTRSGGGQGSGSGPKWVSEAMSSIVLNQQVCRELLEECERSLDIAERRTPTHTHTRSQLLQSYDEVDGPGLGLGLGLGLGSGSAGVVSGAVGPPPCYSPQVKGSDWGHMGALGGALWLGRFPSDSDTSLSMCTATADLTHTQVGESESSRLNTTANQRHSSTTLSADSEEELPLVARASVSPPRPHWTNEVVELVSRMACGRLGSCVAPPISSESEEYEEGLLRGHTPPSRTSQHDLKLEKIFKSFAGGASESEEDVEFHTINRTVSISQDVVDGANLSSSRHRAEQRDQRDHSRHGAEQRDQRDHSRHRAEQRDQRDHSRHGAEQRDHSRHGAEQRDHSRHGAEQRDQRDLLRQNPEPRDHHREDGDPGTECILTETESDSDGTHSLVECSSMYHTPGPGTENPTSEEEDLDVTVEVCRPPLVSLETQSGEPLATVCRPEEREPEYIAADQEQPDIRCISCNKQIDNPSLLSRLPDLAADLAEISSIVCSPGHLQKISSRWRPCYSTPNKMPHPPHSTLAAQTQPLPSLQSLLDTPEHTHSSQKESSVSSLVAHSPTDRQSSEEEADSLSDSQSGFSTASSSMRSSRGRNRESGAAEGEGQGEGSMDDGRYSEYTHSFSSSPSEGQPSFTESLAAFEEEEERMQAGEVEEEPGEEEEGQSEEEEGQSEEEEEPQGAARLSDDDFVSVDNSSERGLGTGTEALVGDIGRNQPTEGTEETERASSTLDEVLQGMMSEHPTSQRARSPGPFLHSKAVMNMEGELDVDDVDRRGGDTAEHYSVPQEVVDPSDDLVKPEDRMEAGTFQSLWSHPHRVIILEHTPGKEPFRKT